MVIVEHSTETLAPLHRLRWRDDRGGPNEPVFEALMVSLSVVVRHELADRVLKRVLSEEDHAVLFLKVVDQIQLMTAVVRAHSGSA